MGMSGGDGKMCGSLGEEILPTRLKRRVILNTLGGEGEAPRLKNTNIAKKKRTKANS